jgi:hypothetical protein
VEEEAPGVAAQLAVAVALSKPTSFGSSSREALRGLSFFESPFANDFSLRFARTFCTSVAFLCNTITFREVKS